MKRRQYAIIIEDEMTQEIREFDTVAEAIEIIHENTYGYLWHEDDELPDDCIEYKNFRGLKEYLLFLNPNKEALVNMYCDSLNKIYRFKHIKQLRGPIETLNSFLIGIGSKTRIYLNSCKYEPNLKPIGPCGL